MKCIYNIQSWGRGIMYSATALLSLGLVMIALDAAGMSKEQARQRARTSSQAEVQFHSGRRGDLLRNARRSRALRRSRLRWVP